MKIKSILFFLFIASSNISYCYLLKPNGVDFDVEYDEPNMSISTSGVEYPLKDLKETNIFYNLGQSSVPITKVPATNLQGNGHIVRIISVPLLPSQEKTVRVWANAVSTHNLTSENSNIELLFVDRLSPSAGDTFAIITGTEFEITYNEPTKKTDGSILDDLLKTTIYYDCGNGIVKFMEILASSPMGGGQIKQRLTIPISEDTEENVSIWWTATDISLNESSPSVPIIKRLDRLSPGGIE